MAEAVKAKGLTLLRGGAYKPRTSPYDFQGLGLEGLKILKRISEEYGLAVISEIVSPADVEMATEYIDVIQIGARNMHNFELLKAVGQVDKPVLLKRGLAATIEEFINAAEYIMSQGNGKLFCANAASVRTNGRRETRWTLRPFRFSNRKRTCPFSSTLLIQREEETSFFRRQKRLCHRRRWDYGRSSSGSGSCPFRFTATNGP